MWTSFVELIRLSIFSAAHLCGGSLGAGIIAVSVIVRIALLPVTLHLARQARAQQAKLLELEPRLAALRLRHASDPGRLFRETRALKDANGVRMMSPGGLVGLLVQAPMLGGLFAAVRSGLGARVRFLWVSDLGRPDGLLIAAVTILAGLTMAVPRPQGSAGGAATLVPMVIGAGLTLLFISSASSAMALSVGAGSVVSGVQGLMLARDRRRDQKRIPRHDMRSS
jgi:YidC/Oxa1 family membrane protein insertase